MPEGLFGAEGLLEAAGKLRAVLAGFDPAGLAGPQCATLVRELSRTEKACAAARALAASRAVAADAHKAAGFASGAEWLAAHMGSTAGEARLAMGTAEALGSCPETMAALVAGELSLAQAHEIAAAQADAPGAEHDLVGLARRSDLSALRQAVRDRILQACDPEQLHQRHHRLRELRHWRDRDGMVRFAGAWAPEVGVPIVNRLELEAERLRAAARRTGTIETFTAHAADALAGLLAGSGQGRPNRCDLVLVCDLMAYRRGHGHPGEPCHLQGGGPLPVGTVKELSQDAFIKAVLQDGVRVGAVKHFGRHIPAELRTALDLGPPPNFEGTACVEEGCGRRYGLEWDHVDPVAHHGPTSYDNLQPRCWPHHRQKTERDSQAGLLGRWST